MRAALVIVVGFVVGCSIPENLFHPPGGGGDGGGGGDSFSGVCDPFMQTGCPPTQRCTWITTGTAPEMGILGCAPNGTVATGGACTIGPAGPTTGYDNCVAGTACEGMKCKAICSGGHMCAGAAVCAFYAGYFQTGSAAQFAGLCEPECDALRDNDFLNNGNKTGTVCSASQGCYGNPSGTDGMPTTFTCSTPQSTTNVHRTACTAANNCMQSGGGIFLNGCAQGYLPLLYDAVGSMQVDCVAMCGPGNTYSGNATQFPAGQAPHMCSAVAPNNDARGTFNPPGGATTATNGDHCFYWWEFEVDMMGMIVLSPFSDTLGICIDHTKFFINPNDVTVQCMGLNNPAGCVAWPTCASLPLTSTGNVLNATMIGCVDTAHLPAPPVRPPSLSDLRLPRGALSR